MVLARRRRWERGPPETVLPAATQEVRPQETRARFAKTSRCRGSFFPQAASLVNTMDTRQLERMARGHQKIQSQQKNAKKQAEMKKSKGHDQKTAAKAALVFTCSVCKSQMPDPKTFKQHFESKHPKSPLPPELEGVEA
ncbi:zinc finger protein 706 isoform X1 [Fundulus heteroclitus]|nr:zinc finger protein 706 isoform X1 [Fundulus heteroclitus]